ncbi:hypothetical protein K435DRAFT_852145 [Dendrothele bispora CBS 962.96]|uniref:Uncharacterized protein n=1 Tax=Dendrothele bispora (strain CBS 962.96) TaxID=1314807 RepID=A0A4S8MKA8_DENBC|nr:hypothetical protein K435DRAFT_852145 [Dendrothele bispora CBS 962.96]
MLEDPPPLCKDVKVSYADIGTFTYPDNNPIHSIIQSQTYSHQHPLNVTLYLQKHGKDKANLLPFTFVINMVLSHPEDCTTLHVLLQQLALIIIDMDADPTALSLNIYANVITALTLSVKVSSTMYIYPTSAISNRYPTTHVSNMATVLNMCLFATPAYPTAHASDMAIVSNMCPFATPAYPDTYFKMDTVLNVCHFATPYPTATTVLNTVSVNSISTQIIPSNTHANATIPGIEILFDMDRLEELVLP